MPITRSSPRTGRPAARRPACARAGWCFPGTGAEHDLGAIDAMPLAAGGHSLFNVSNLATAALGAAGLGVEPATIAAVFARFGADPADNAGRLMRYELGGLNLIVDFAHNPAALAGLVDFAQHLRSGGRLALLLGQAGNREDADLERLAAVAAAARPDLVVLKEMRGYLRGRDAGEIPAILRRALGQAGVADAAIVEVEGEDAAVRQALAWARAGDVLMLAVHTPAGRTARTHPDRSPATPGLDCGPAIAGLRYLRPMAGRIPQAFIDELIARTDIVELIGGRVQLKKAGREWKACCPFHNEKTPSFWVSPDKQFYHCFGCGAHGTALGFLMEHDKLPFPDAVEELASRLGLEVPRDDDGRAARARPGEDCMTCSRR